MVKNEILKIKKNIDNLKKTNSKTIFISGVFNTLHIGHFRLFKFAKQQANILILGITSDSISEGATIDHFNRLDAIRNIKDVDISFIIEDNLNEIIKFLKPNFVLKGFEHKNKFNPETEIVKSYGGKILFSSGEIEFSSLENMRKKIKNSKIKFLNIPYDYMDRHSLSFQRFINVIKKIKESRVIVIGDTIVDEYNHCDPIGISQEDPSIVVRSTKKKKFIGGAAIVAAHAAANAKKVNFLTIFGNDNQRKFAEKKLKKYNVSTFAIIDDTRPTTYKKKFRSQNMTLLRINKFSEQEINEEYQNSLYEKFCELLNKTDLIILSDFNYGVLTTKLIEKIILKANEEKKLVIADSQTSSQLGNVLKYQGTSLITPTEYEARVSLKDKSSGLAQLAENLIKKTKTENLIITLGSKGVYIQRSKNKRGKWLSDQMPAFNVNSSDNAGAGDALLVSTGLAMSAGSNIWEAGFLGSLVAAYQVSYVGNHPLSFDEILSDLKAN